MKTLKSKLRHIKRVMRTAWLHRLGGGSTVYHQSAAIKREKTLFDWLVITLAMFAIICIFVHL